MDEKKLELRLGPPGGDDEYSSSTSPALSLGFSCIGAKRGFSATVELKNEGVYCVSNKVRSFLVLFLFINFFFFALSVI